MEVEVIKVVDSPDSFVCGEDVYQYLLAQESLPDFLVGMLAFVDKYCTKNTIYLFKADDILEKDEG